MPKKPSKKAVANRKTEAKRQYLSQSDVPSYGVEQALRVARAIADSYGKNPTKPLRVAEAMNTQPGSSGFRMLCGASIAYGLTEGGYNSDLISLTPLGRRIVAPTREGDDAAALREAVLRPRVIRDFLTRYNESKLPAEAIGSNVLEELGVPGDRAKSVFGFIVDSAKAVGFLREVKGQTYVDLDSVEVKTLASDDDVGANTDVAEAPPFVAEARSEERSDTPHPIRRNGRVFITHGRNKEVVAQLRDLLTFGGFTPVVAIDNETVAKPVPDKVLDEMRSCDAAIIHVGTEVRLMDPDGKEHRMLNQNVLIEIGAAMALYGRKFILLVERGATLPTNLQGLYEVRYEGEKLDYEATMKLLRAFNDFRV